MPQMRGRLLSSLIASGWTILRRSVRGGGPLYEAGNTAVFGDVCVRAKFLTSSRTEGGVSCLPRTETPEGGRRSGNGITWTAVGRSRHFERHSGGRFRPVPPAYFGGHTRELVPPHSCIRRDEERETRD